MGKYSFVFNLVFVQLFFCLLILLTITFVKLLDTDEYKVFIEKYAEKATYDISTSLVYEGE